MCHLEHWHPDLVIWKSMMNYLILNRKTWNFQIQIILILIKLAKAPMKGKASLSHFSFFWYSIYCISQYVSLWNGLRLIFFFTVSGSDSFNVFLSWSFLNIRKWHFHCTMNSFITKGQDSWWYHNKSEPASEKYNLPIKC